jgi:hypothetical protein
MESPVTRILAEMRQKGVTLWSEDGQLRYRAPKGALTTEEVARLRASKCELVAFLQHATKERYPHAPLTYTQLARWQTYRTGERRPMRTVAAALRLRGRLDREALRKALSAIVQRQDALRTTIVVVDDVPVQRVAASGEDRLAVHDLTALAAELQQPEVDRIAMQIMTGTVDLATGPLFEARLIELRSHEHVLIVAMEHLIADGHSLGILMRELLAAYGQVMRGEVISLPVIAMQFAEYAEAQVAARQSWQRDHSRYWVERLAGCQRVRFAPDSGSRGTAAGWGTVSVTLDAALKGQLRECCRKRRTTLVMGVLTAYAALVLRWCSVPELIIQCLSDCRTSAAIENTIGFFASPLYLRVALRPQDSFADLMNRVTAEYCQAHEHADCSLFESQTPRPEFTRNTSFNWVMQGSPRNDPVEPSTDALECSAIPLAHTIMKELRLDQEPGMLFYDTDTEVTGIVHFPLDRFAVRTMERFADDFLRFTTTLLNDPDMRVQDVVRS